MNYPEQMAEMLDQHQDYKVLRRMSPDQLQIDAACGGNALRIAIVDVETTGLVLGSDKIIEFGALVLEIDPTTYRCLGLIDAFQGFDDPGFPIPVATSAINGITDVQVAGHRLDDAQLARMFSGVSLVVAHNAGFDRKFLEQRLPFFKTLNWGCSQTQIDWMTAGINSTKLDYIAHRYGFFYEGHRAKIDCCAVLKVLRAPMPNSHNTGLAHLVAQIKKPLVRIWALKAPYDLRGALKFRGYAWDAQRGIWNTTVPMVTLQQESFWLRDNIYGRPVILEFETLDAKVLFSDRRGNVQYEMLPPKEAS